MAKKVAKKTNPKVPKRKLTTKKKAAVKKKTAVKKSKPLPTAQDIQDLDADHEAVNMDSEPGDGADQYDEMDDFLQEPEFDTIEEDVDFEEPEFADFDERTA